MQRDSQAERIVAYLRSHPGGLTPVDALAIFGCFRLAARISDIKAELLGPHEAIEVKWERHEGGKHARYVLVDTAPRTLWDAA